MNATGANIDERLNNAIVRIAWITRNGPLERPTHELATHWERYWLSATRRNVAEALRLGKLERYAAWYARAWALLTPQQRTQAPDPRSIDVSFAGAVDSAVRSVLNGAQAAADAGAKASAYVGKEAAKLAQEIAPVATTWLILGAVIIGAWALGQRSRG